MTPFFVADVGNSRIKCGLVHGKQIHVIGILDDGFQSWSELLENARRVMNASRDNVLSWPWIVASVRPARCDELIRGLSKLRCRVDVLSDYRRIPLTIDVEHPERVGIDRMLSAAAVHHRFANGESAAIISAGTAVTVDLVDSGGTFRGGAILPGSRLMAQSLHNQTAKLPLVDAFDPASPVPARNTEAAIASGVSAAITGGIDRIVDCYRKTESGLRAFLTGGDAGLLAALRCSPTVLENLTLTGLALVVEQRP